MTITFPPDIAVKIERRAEIEETTPEDLVIEAAKKLLATTPRLVPRDDWERRLLSVATSAGVSLSDEAVSSEGIYD